MPRSKIVPEIRYGGEGVSTLELGPPYRQTSRVIRLYADYFIDGSLAIRISPDEIVAILDTRPRFTYLE